MTKKIQKKKNLVYHIQKYRSIKSHLLSPYSSPEIELNEKLNMKYVCIDLCKI